MADNRVPNPDGTYSMPEVVWIPLSNLEPGPTYRTQFRAMDELENSIRQFGLLTPLWVRPHPTKDNCYVIFAGRRRYEAAKKIAREKCDPALDAAIAVQVGSYLMPCRVFRDLAKVHEGLLSLTENMARHDPSTIDTARELLRLKGLMEAETGRPAKVEHVIASLCGGRPGERRIGRRHVYRLLRIAELDPEVAAAAKECHLSSDLLEQLVRLPQKPDQLELVGLITDLHLSRSQVREIVSRKLSAQDVKVGDVAAEITTPSEPVTTDPVTASVTVRNEEGGEGTQDPIHFSSSNISGKGPSAVASGSLSRAVEPNDEARPSASAEAETTDEDDRRSWHVLNLASLICDLRKQVDVDLLRAGDMLEAWAAGEGKMQGTCGDDLEQWIAELGRQNCYPDEIERIKKALQNEMWSRLDIEIMRLLYKYQGILPEHLPGYAKQIRESMGESSWYQVLVKNSLELLAALGQPHEAKKVPAMSRRIIDVIFHEMFWLCTVYDPRLEYHVERLPTLRKTEFASSMYTCLNSP